MITAKTTTLSYAALSKTPPALAGELMLVFEEPCSKLQGIFDRKECGLFLIRSLFGSTPC
jgi:hypothetical protein